MIRERHLLRMRTWLSASLPLLLLAGCYGPEYPKPEDDHVIDAFPADQVDEMLADLEGKKLALAMITTLDNQVTFDNCRCDRIQRWITKLIEQASAAISVSRRVQHNRLINSH